MAPGSQEGQGPGPKAEPEATGLGERFVGRDAEIHILSDAIDSARHGTARCLMVVGEPGIGKTTLAEVAASSARDAGFSVHWGRCSEEEGVPALWPWIQILRSLSDQYGPEALETSLGTSGPPLNWLIGAPRTRTEAPVTSDPFAMLDAIVRLVGDLSRRTPAALFLDDIHEADERSLVLLRMLTQQFGTWPLLTFCCFRRPEVGGSSRKADILWDVSRTAQTVELGGLAQAEVQELMRRQVNTVPAEELVALVHHATEGNPLFVSEMTRLLNAEGRLASTNVSIASLPVPDGVDQAISRRLDFLGAEARRLMEAASVLGAGFGFPALREVTGYATEDLLQMLSEGVSAGILVEVSEEVGRYRFAHGLVREALYRRIEPDRRRQLHLATAEGLMRREGAPGGSHAQDLGHHFLEALPLGDPERALEVSIRSAKAANEVFAYDKAAASLRGALRALDFLEKPDLNQRCELLLQQGLAENLAGHRDESRATLRMARDLARTLDAAEMLGRAALGFGRESWAVGEVDWELVSMLQEAITALEGEESSLLVDLLTRLAIELTYSDQEEQRKALADRGLEIARVIGDPQAMSYAIETKATVAAGPRNPAERAEAGLEVIRLADQTGRQIGHLSGRLLRIPALLEMGDLLAFQYELDAYDRQARTIRAAAHVWFSTVTNAMWALAQGRFEKAASLIDEAEMRGKEARSDEARSYATFQRFVLLAASGSDEGLEEAQAALDELSVRSPAMPAYRAASGVIALRLGHRAEARRRFEEIVARDPAAIPKNLGWTTTMALLAELAVALEDVDRCRRLFDELHPFGDRYVVFDYAVACLGAVPRFRGMLAAGIGDLDLAERLLSAATEMNNRLGAGPAAADSRRELAKVLLLRNRADDRDRAAELVVGVNESYAALGISGPRSAEVAGLLADLGIGDGEGTVAPVRTPGLFHRDGDYWSLVFEGDAFRLKDAKGLHYLARLLAEPGREFHALDLFTGTSGSAAGAARDEDLSVSTGETAGPVLDPEAKAAYKRRLEDLEQETEEADAANDPERAARAREERDFLVRELAASVGLGGRDRPTGSAAERARVNVTKAIRSAIGRIKEHSPALAQHLDRTVHTGTFCSYQPDPRAQVGWRIST